jgi:hypothetical protein
MGVERPELIKVVSNTRLHMYSEVWQRIQVEKWFDPAVQEFINRE